MDEQQKKDFTARLQEHAPPVTGQSFDEFAEFMRQTSASMGRQPPTLEQLREVWAERTEGGSERRDLITDGWRLGPYGTNRGDVWLGVDSVVGKMLMERDGLTLVHEMVLKDGKLQEVMYSTDNPEMIAEATAGHEKWLEAQAAQN